MSPSYFLSYCSSQRLSSIYTEANREGKNAKFESSPRGIWPAHMVGAKHGVAYGSPWLTLPMRTLMDIMAH